MKIQIFKYWNRVRSSFWFLPTLMAGGAVALSYISVALEKSISDWLLMTWDWTFKGGAEGASSVLGAISGSMITLAGVVFSMTLVALSLASSQLGPRLLRNFMRDTVTQVVLGTFVSTFLYCLLVLRTIHRTPENYFVPHLSVTLGVLFAVVSVGVLIYFIHHVSVSIQANEILARVGKELLEELDHLFPEHIGKGEGKVVKEPPEADFLDTFEREACPVNSRCDGYVQLIDTEALVALALEKDIVIRLQRPPGSYVIAGCPLIQAWPIKRVDDTVREKIHTFFVLGNQRTVDQDVEFAVNQLVEVAVRALSPGINDPFTAITCVDHLGSALCRLAAREQPSPYRYDKENALRVIAPIAIFPDILDGAFNQIRQHSNSNAAVTIRLLETIAIVARFAHRRVDIDALLKHAEMIVRGARKELSEPEDLKTVENRYQSMIDSCPKK